ncbi:MAG: dihydropteroate synthase [Eubacteriaceae bacterium]|jgi:dihydropteroate synthase|nr:dihydropteroate synthase [Eubacteriaceae bacterium]
MQIGNTAFDFENSVYIMGILNVTPDSFSDGGHYDQLDNAFAHVEQMIRDGADIIDIGGESTRPGCTPVPTKEEIDRVIPVIEGIQKRFDIPISIDTFKAETARAVLDAGAHMINDIWGFKKEPEIAKVVAEFDVPCCIMHNRNNENYPSLLEDMQKDLEESIDIALNAGVKKEHIILDPGVGFAKSMNENLLVIKHLNFFVQMGYPLLLGTSRKRVIDYVLNLPLDQRDEGTAATTVAGVLEGATIFRVHDVLSNRRAADMALAIKNAAF